MPKTTPFKIFRNERNGWEGMKNLAIRLGSMVMMLLLLVGCSHKNNYEELLAASWFEEGESEPIFTLYSDGTCEIDNEYGTGKWSIVNEDQLKLTNYYGETETVSIISIEDGCLTLGDSSGNVVSLWNTAEKALGSNAMADNNEKNKEAKISSDILYKNLYECSDGIAWLYWIDSEKSEHYGLMNLNGKVFFELDSEFNNYQHGSIIDGYTYIESEGNFVLIKSDGTITYQETDTTDDNEYNILASGGGFFLVEEKISNITENHKKIGVMDASGKWKIEPIVLEEYISDKVFKQSKPKGYQYRGEGVFSIDYESNNDNLHLFMSTESRSIFEVSQISGITSFYKGEMICQSFDGGESGGHYGKILKITKDGQIIEYPVNGTLITSSEDYVAIAHGSNYCISIYDMEGKLKKDLSEYNIYSPRFENGYFIFIVKGADDLLYIAAINCDTMDFSFDPKVVEDAFTTFYDNQAIIILEDGTSARINLKTGEITKLPFDVPTTDSYSNAVNGELYKGVIVLEETATKETRFYNWDGEEIIPTFK